MTGPHPCPLGQRQWHEQAAAIAYQPPSAPRAGMPTAAPNPFIPNPQLVKEEREH